MKRAPQKLRIGELLVRDGLITEKQLEEALGVQRERGGKIVQNLILLQHLDRHTFLKFLSRQPGMASIELMNYTIPEDVIKLIPGDFAVKNEIFPIDKMGSYLTVAMACPLDEKTVSELVELTGFKVRTLLVSLEDIEAALARYYPEVKLGRPSADNVRQTKTVSLSDFSGLASTLPKVETAMTLDGVLNLVASLKSLPALPDTVHRIQEAIENPNTLTSEVVRIIERDPALSARMISLANSAAYAVRHKVDNVLMAVTMLGLKEVYSLVLSSAVIKQFDHSEYFDYKAHWRRSLYCGTAAKAILQICGGHAGSTIFAAGLLHDLGQLVLAELMPKRYAQVDMCMTDHDIVRRESEVFGIGHPEVGYTLSTEWGLPEEISLPIRFHQNPAMATSHRETVAIVGLAAAMADRFVGRNGQGELSSAGEEAMAMLEIEPAQLGEICKDAETIFSADS